ncbi:MAG TPA: hypothetical protein VGM30_12565 [Puia sp.]|jgi:hypothetical protein
MNDCLLIRSLLLRSLFGSLFLGALLLPVITRGQDPYTRPASLNYPAVYNPAAVYNPEGAITSNVPLNEINIHAFRHFHRRWPTVAGESWVKSEDGYIVNFIADALHQQAHFDRRGAFLYALKSYSGSKIARDLEGIVKKKYRDYMITVVTEITDGEKTFYLVKIENSADVKTLSVCDGKIEVTEELINGGVVSAQ